MGTKTFANLRTEVGRLGHWSVTDTTSASYLAATAAAEAGLRAIDRLVVQGANFPWLKVETTFTLASDLVDGYKLAVPARLLRVLAKSFRYSTSEASRLLWLDLEDIDRRLEPIWRTTSSTKGTPAYVTREAGYFWIADQPSDTHKAAYPYIYYGYFQREDSGDSTLLLPNELFDCAICAALAFYLKQKDDNDQQYYRDQWQREFKPMLFAWSGVSGSDERMDGAPLAQDYAVPVDTRGYGF